MIIIFLIFIVYPVTIYLLYNFKPYGKQFYSILVLIGFIFTIIQGPVAYDGWTLAVEVLGCLNAGAILILLYFSPVSKEFNRQRQMNRQNINMQTLIILALVIVVAWVLFRPFSKREIDRYNDKNWPDMNL